MLKVWGLTCFSDLRPRGRLRKLGEKHVLLIVGTKNARFRGHKDIWQKSQDKEETNKTNSATVLKSALTEQKVILTWGGCNHQLMKH